MKRNRNMERESQWEREGEIAGQVGGVGARVGAVGGRGALGRIGERAGRSCTRNDEQRQIEILTRREG